MTSLSLALTHPWPDYALMDSGNARKYERYGPYTFIRPEPQALWQPRKPDWPANAEFIGGSDEDGGGKWHMLHPHKEAWPISRGPVKFWATCTPFRHLAFFPDQAPQWDWMREKITRHTGQFELLNLFGYTGVASLIAAEAGAKVTHIDASKKAISAAVENQKLSGLVDKPIRWMVDDCMKFLAREVRRGKIYHGIILDPPKFGRGPKGEAWHLFEQLPEMLALCRQLMNDQSQFLILTAYAIRASALALDAVMKQTCHDLGGTIESGEMAIVEEGTGRLLPTAIFSRWSVT